MQYTPHYNLNLPEGTDIVNPLIQDNPNYSAIDTALYDNKLRVTGTATHTKTGTNHSIVLADSDIPVFRFVATGDYVIGDTFSVDGVTVTPRLADGSSIPAGAFKINSTVIAVLDGTLLNLINIAPAISADEVSYNGSDVETMLDYLDAGHEYTASTVYQYSNIDETINGTYQPDTDGYLNIIGNLDNDSYSSFELNVNGIKVFGISKDGVVPTASEIKTRYFYTIPVSKHDYTSYATNHAHITVRFIPKR